MVLPEPVCVHSRTYMVLGSSHNGTVTEEVVDKIPPHGFMWPLLLAMGTWNLEDNDLRTVEKNHRRNV